MDESKTGTDAKVGTDAKPVDTMTEEFRKVIVDFIGDLKQTFPEYEPLINKWWKDRSKYEDDKSFIEGSVRPAFEFCKKKLPPRFFDILYQNEDMFKEDSSMDTEFLPNICFRNLWGFDITQKTRDTIWKYLQLILFSVVGTMENKDMFGDTAKLFEGICEDEFKTKLEETMMKMQDLFKEGGEASEAGASEAGGGEGANEGINIPKPEDIHKHISGMLDGKLGMLAKEIAEETANDLNMDMENVTDMKGVFNNLIKNPTKLMGLVKNVGDKIDTKIKSGDMKESELITEATEMLGKLKGMPGMGDIQELLNKMGMGGAKVNMGAMEAQLDRNLKTAKMKERMNAKAEANRAAKEQNIGQQVAKCLEEAKYKDEQLVSIFNAGEKAERTPRGSQPQPQANKKKKKGKK
jgi:hypothetical protein